MLETLIRDATGELRKERSGSHFTFPISLHSSRLCCRSAVSMDWNGVQMVSVYVMVHAVVSRREVASTKQPSDPTLSCGQDAHRLKVRQVVLNLLRAQLAEARALGTLYALVAEQVVCGRTDNTCVSN